MGLQETATLQGRTHIGSETKLSADGQLVLVAMHGWTEAYKSTAEGEEAK